MVLKEKQELTFTSENSTVTVVSWSYVEVENDGGFYLLHIILAWAQLTSKETLPKSVSPKVYIVLGPVG